MSEYTSDNPQVITLDPATWLHLEGSYDSFLHRESDGKMCCMGQACLTWGFTPQQLLGLDGLSDFSYTEYPIHIKRWLDMIPHEGLVRIYMLNDTGQQSTYHSAVLTMPDEELVDKLNNALVEVGAPFRFALP